jgi:hypothetical protein
MKYLVYYNRKVGFALIDNVGIFKRGKSSPLCFSKIILEHYMGWIREKYSQ